MKTGKSLIFYKYLIIALLSFGHFKEAFAARLVTTIKPQPVTNISELSLMAEVLERKSEVNGRGTYRLSMDLPAGLIPAVKNGSFVKVTIPTIHQNIVSAQIVSLSKNHAELILNNQVQQLEGQKLKVDLPVLPVNLFKIPFQSILSPRGLTAEVFLLLPEMTVQLVQITPLQILSDGAVIVSSEHLKNASVVVQGTDNLLSGDSVQVNKESGAIL